MENSQVGGFEISSEDMKKMDALDEYLVTGTYYINRSINSGQLFVRQIANALPDSCRLGSCRRRLV